MDGLTTPLFLGGLRHEQLTSNQMDGDCRLKALPGGTSSPSISPRPKWVGAQRVVLSM